MIIINYTSRTKALTGFAFTTVPRLLRKNATKSEQVSWVSVVAQQEIKMFDPSRRP